ncbi:A kinase (PRKA) anchor protein 1b [Stegostoma tigrinum]|uniref:A kinase (PRKA) anchor protein 1b n=1 Tax=Stegostoma tigrinum TaxID=3053191 RepID=UPI00202ADB43|nr:A kinase (PRKA) anchor protein 1b [Stegostoma tigrinum]XP_059511304.1 A kinase (PRKA) anchor protein 1b [Stegostoma tigrinum]
MALRFRTIFPYTLPGVLALIGWWWYITRKKGRESGRGKAKLALAPESSAEAGGGEHCADLKDPQNVNTVAELTNASEEKADETVVKPLKLVPALQVETSEQAAEPESSLCHLTDKRDANVESNTPTMLLSSSPRSQEVLFMSNVQGPLQTSPKVEKEGYLHQMVEKVSGDPLEIWQPPVCSVVKSPAPFPIHNFSVNSEAERDSNGRALPGLGRAEREPPAPDGPSMERPEPEGENAGNLTEPPCFKATLNNVRLSPFLIPRQDSDRGSRLGKDPVPAPAPAPTGNGLPADAAAKGVARDEIEAAAAGLISEVITAAKQELFASQLGPCTQGACVAGAARGKSANPSVQRPATADDSVPEPGIDGVRQASEEDRSVSRAGAASTAEERPAGPDGRSEFAGEVPAPEKPSEEDNLAAEDSGCHSEDGAVGDGLPESGAAWCDPASHQGTSSSRAVSRVGHSCEGELPEPEMALGESGTRGGLPKDCEKDAQGDQSRASTEEVQPTAKKHLEELNAAGQDSGIGVVYSDATGEEEPLHPKVTPAPGSQQTDAVCDPVTGGTPLEQDPKHKHGPLQQHQGARVPNGGGVEEGADGNSQLLLEMEFDHSGGSDVNSMDSNDSGCPAGGPDTLNKDGATLNAIQDQAELTIWEVQVPKHLVGRLIGKQGRFVSFLKQSSGAKIYISTLPYTQDFQICHIEGNQQQVDKALNLIGKKFKELDLRNLYVPPPPLTLPSLPITSWLMLPDGVTVEVLVVNIVNAGHMFVQQHTHPTCHVLRSMDQQMFLLYSQPGIPTLTPPLEVGIICAAPAVDGAWWRAQVVAYFEETNEVEIRYVDYGGYERVKIEALRQIRSDFVSLPFQGTEVLLDNIMPPPGADHFSEEANTAMDEMTRGAALLAQVTGYDNSGVPLINLWSIIGDEVLFLNRILVEKGHAQWIESY